MPKRALAASMSNHAAAVRRPCTPWRSIHMTDRLPRLYAHPFSSYCQKVLVALYENDTPFDYRHLEDPQASAELAAVWPMKRFPGLVEGGRVGLEATRIIED